MSAKKVAGIGTTVVLLLILIWVVISAASVGSEASKLDNILKASVSDRKPITDVDRQLSDAGLIMKPTSATEQAGRGGDHWAFVYRTWLTVKLTTSEDGLVHGYHLDREGSVF